MKIGISKRLSLLAISGSIMTFLTFALVGIIAVIYIWNITSSNNRAISELAIDYTEVYSRNKELLQLELLVRSKATQISNVVREVEGDVTTLVNEISLLLSYPERYKPHKLPTIATALSLIRQPVVRFNQDLLSSEQKLRAVMPEVELLGNLEESLKTHNRLYDSVFLGSTKGYAIVSYEYPQYHFDPEVLDFTKPDVYDTYNRPWYKQGISKHALSFTDLYLDHRENHLSLSVVTPYFHQGQLAGVVGVDINGSVFTHLKGPELDRKNGECFVLDTQGSVIFSSLSTGTLRNSRQDSLLADADLQTMVTASSMVAGHRGIKRYNLDGKEYYLAYAPVPGIGWSVGVLIDPQSVAEPASQASSMMQGLLSNLNQFMTSTFEYDLLRSLILLPLLLVLISFLASRSARSFSKPVVSLMKGVKEIARGNFQQHVRIRTGDEIELLADNFNVMSDALNQQMSELRAVTAEKERISTELNVATRIQLSMLPQNFPSRRDRYELYALSIPTKEVGGDFYDFYLLDQNHLAITIADVSGKGVPAALFMVISKTILKNNTLLMGGESNLARAVERANLQLYQDNREEMFVTVFTGILDLQTGLFTYVSAGHNPPLVGRALSNRYTYLNSGVNRPMLGVLDDISYVQQTLQLEFGDTLFLYTDGVTEAMNLRQEQFGTDRLAGVLSQQPHLDLKQQGESVLQAVRSFVGAAEQSDDITILSLRYLNFQQDDGILRSSHMGKASA